jgi:uroporphyrinogen decarboxylase
LTDKTITPRERFLMALNHKEPPDRIPIHDNIWASTQARWRLQGMSSEIPVNELFGFDLVSYGTDNSPQYPIRVLERTPEYIVETNAMGGTRKNHRDYSTTPELLDYGVKTRADWEAAKKRIVPSYTRVDWVSLKNNYERSKADSLFTTFNGITGYDHCQSYIRPDQLLPLMLDEPEWIRDMVETQADMIIEMCKIVLKEGYRFDGAWMFNDMGYRNAPFFSPRIYRELIKPADVRLFGFFHSQGMKTLLHSCGCVKPLIPDLIDAGLDCLQPLEVKAGMDVVELKKQYGRDLAFMGGIDVRAIADPDPSVIEAEIARKIPVAMKDGGYIYHSDHSIPINVTYKQYCHTMELVHKYGQYQA